MNKTNLNTNTNLTKKLEKNTNQPSQQERNNYFATKMAQFDTLPVKREATTSRRAFDRSSIVNTRRLSYMK